MGKYVKIFLMVIIFITLIRVINMFITDKNVYINESKTIIGMVTDIKKDNDKSVIDVKSDYKYKITIYKDVYYELGSRVKVNGNFETPSNNTIFNLFNYRNYLLSKNIKFVSTNPDITLLSNNNHVLYKIKNMIIKQIDKYKSKAYIKSFVMGDTSLISKDVIKVYQNLGISHLFAISGMHVGLFIGVINALFKKFKYNDIIMFLFLLFFFL